MRTPTDGSPHAQSSTPALRSPKGTTYLASHLQSAEPVALSPAPDSHTATLPESDGYADLSAPAQLLPEFSENPASFSYAARCCLSGLFPVLHLPGRQLAGYTSPAVSAHLQVFHPHKKPLKVMTDF